MDNGLRYTSPKEAILWSHWNLYLGAGGFAFLRDWEVVLVRFLPGACGSPFLGESSFAAFTSSSSLVLGTERTPRITSLKCLNSGVESNGPSLINFLSGREVSSRAPAVSSSLGAHPWYGL